MLAGSIFIYFYKYWKDMGTIWEQTQREISVKAFYVVQTSGQSIKVFGSGTQLIVTGKVSLNSVVRSGWEVGNTGTAGLSVGAGSEFSGLHPVW